MATALPLVTHTTNYLKAGGVLSIATRNASTGNPGAFRDFGNVPSVTLARNVDQSEVIESRSGTWQTAKKYTDKVSYAITAVLMNMTIENFALALGAASETITPDTTPVTGEELYEPTGGGSYHIGQTTARPEGLGVIGSFTSLAIKATAHATSTVVTAGTVVSNTGVAYVYTVGGTTAASAPTFPTAGGTVADGATAILKHLGPVACAGAGVDYSVAIDPAVIQITPGTTDLTTSIGRMPSGYTLTLIAAYTPAATPYERVIPLSAEAEYFLRFDGQAADGTAVSWVAPYCQVTGSGDSEFINPSAPQQLTLAITPLQRVTGQYPIIPKSKVVDEWINA